MKTELDVSNKRTTDNLGHVSKDRDTHTSDPCCDVSMKRRHCTVYVALIQLLCSSLNHCLTWQWRP